MFKFVQDVGYVQYVWWYCMYFGSWQQVVCGGVDVGDGVIVGEYDVIIMYGFDDFVVSISGGIVQVWL